ncbi:MAG: MarR family transcriptional regulator [Deltaproteobacteria bacterium]|nr:MarR family transcriptional regulator [Deltaproteobacteria bacterium]
MKEPAPQSYQEVFSLIGEFSRALRCCQQEESFCLDLTLSQFFILHSIAGKGIIQLAELHDILSVEKSTTTRMVSPLIRRGLVIQEKSEQDSRALNLRLTPQGEETYEKIWVCLAEFLDTIQKGIPGGERKKVYAATRAFLGAVQGACKTRSIRKMARKGEGNGCCRRNTKK